jgi:hypothetical protein
MMYVAFYVGKGKLFNRLIRGFQYVTGCKDWQASHVELLRDYDEATDTWRAYSSSAMDGGVRIKQIRLDPNKWVVFQLEQGLGEQADAWMKQNLGAKYDWLGIVGQVFKRAGQNQSKYYCNEAIQSMIGLEGKYNPATLMSRFKHG